MGRSQRLVYLVNQAATFFSHRLPWARRARDTGWDVHVAGPLEVPRERFTDEGFTPHPLPLVRGLGGPRAQARGLRALVALMRQLRPDVAHVVGTQFVAVYGPTLRLAGARAVIASITGLGHAFLTEGRAGSAMRLITLTGYRLCQAQGARFVFQNRDDLATVRSYPGMNSLAADLIRGSGVDTHVFEFQPTRATDMPVVVLPARLIREKGIHQFVDAARVLREQGLSFRAVLVGSVDHANPSAVREDELRSWIDSGLVEWHGHSRNMVATYSDADIVVLPSLREGLPKALLEAASMGKPLVATDVPGCREIVDDGDNGFLVPLHDAGAMAEALAKLIRDQELRAKLGRRGRELVMEHFSAEVISRAYVELYDAVS